MTGSHWGAPVFAIGDRDTIPALFTRIDTPEIKVDDPLRQIADTGFRAEIAGDEPAAATQPLGGRGGRVAVPADDQDLGPRFGQTLRDHQADATRASGDHRGLAAESEEVLTAGRPVLRLGVLVGRRGRRHRSSPWNHARHPSADPETPSPPMDPSCQPGAPGAPTFASGPGSGREGSQSNASSRFASRVIRQKSRLRNGLLTTTRPREFR